MATYIQKHKKYLLFSGSKWLHVIVIVLINLCVIATSHSTVETLPGYSGELSFKLETGYIGVGDTDDVQLFYYFIESQRDPVRDPLLLWLTGGPGCSAFSGLAYEIGPITFDVKSFNGSLPTLQSNPYAWTEVANIIFLDAPVGTGFSYSKTSEGYYTSDTASADATYSFLRKWLIDHPKFLNNPLYIAGDSYSGILVPMIVLEISNGNDIKSKPTMNLQGYMLGNPVTDLHKDENSRIAYAHRMALISDELYEGLQESCNGEYVYPDIENSECINYLQLAKECTAKVNDAQILESKCDFDSPKENASYWDLSFIEDISIDIILPLTRTRPLLWCRNDNYLMSYIWANDPGVQEALYVRNETISDWKRCNKSLSYDYDIDSVVDYHRNLTKKGFRVLVYSGDHDMMIPYVGTHAWVTSLNVTISDPWRPWFVDGQVAGFTEKYGEDTGFDLTFVTVKGGGHTAPEYKPKQCLELVDRWLSRYLV